MGKNGMLKKNSMFLRVLISVVCVMLLQTVLITLVLFTNGTMKTLENNSISSLVQNAENRRNTLQQAMVNNWSNIDKLEADMQEDIKQYLDDNGKTIDDLISQKSLQRPFLRESAGTLLSSLRLTMSTGAFMYFANPDVILDTTSSVDLEGMYFRDLDPFSTPGNYSDVQLLIGQSQIREDNSLERDNLHSITFSFTPGDNEKWNCLYNTYANTIDFPDLTSNNLSYWSRPYTVNNSSADSNTCITYNRPLFYEDRLIGMIGTEALLGFLNEYMPSNDYASYGKGGYMLVRYDATSDLTKSIECDIYSINGSYINRAYAQNATIRLDNQTNTIYTTNAEGEKAHLSLQTLNIYNSNTPFSNNKIALLGIVVDSALFATITTLQNGLYLSSIVSMVIGIILLAIIIRLTTHPLIELAGQITRSNPDAPVMVKTKSKMYEIVLLSSTINAMNDKRKIIEEELREERERYLIALESAADTFLEYNIVNDELIIYHFTNVNQGSSVSSDVVTRFFEVIKEGKICPDLEIENLLMFLSGENKSPIEIPIITDLFPHIYGAVSDGEYYWFLLKSSSIYDDNGKIKKVICVAKLITEEKIKERILHESTLRDITTKLYNETAGFSLIDEAVSSLDDDDTYSIIILHMVSYGLFEAYYGRIFAAALLMVISKVFTLFKGDKDIHVRLDSDKFLLYNQGFAKKDIVEMLKKMADYVNKIYMGENKEIYADAIIGVATGKGEPFDEMYYRANQTLQYAIKNKLEACFYDEIPSDKLPKDLALRPNPIETEVNISRDSIIGFTFDIFEKTNDIRSVINLLLEIIGELYNLSQIIICSYNSDFGSMQATYQWNDRNETPHHTNIEKFNGYELAALQRQMDENGTLSCKKMDLSASAKQLLCILPEEKGSAFICMTYENMLCNGAIVFKSNSEVSTLSNLDRNALFEITKIISARISIDISHSASKSKSEFLSRISHEIRTPMNAIIGMTNIARDVKDDQRKLLDALNKIDFSSRHLLSLINDVLDMAKIESGKLKIVTEPVVLDSLVESVDILMRPQIENKNIRFEIKKEYLHNHLLGDEYHIRQVLVNFLSNACKFTPEKGTITLTISEIKCDEYIGYFRFSVRDTGIGISKEDQNHVFLAFEQGSSTDSRVGRQQGTGLGLTISSSIINIMGSKIELVSDVNQGSDFFFTLKLGLDRVEHQNDDAKLTSEKENLLNGKRLLLVEDNEINIEVALFLLKDLGATIEVARNGKEAVDMFFDSEVNYYDAILMDIQMPIMDGLQATREIRKNASRKDAKSVPIIAMTANAFDEDMKKSIESGMNGHVAKPIEIEKLVSALKSIFKKK